MHSKLIWASLVARRRTRGDWPASPSRPIAARRRRERHDHGLRPAGRTAQDCRRRAGLPQERDAAALERDGAAGQTRARRADAGPTGCRARAGGPTADRRPSGGRACRSLPGSRGRPRGAGQGRPRPAGPGLPGPAGPAGPAGQPGPTGATGATGPARAAGRNGAARRRRAGRCAGSEGRSGNRPDSFGHSPACRARRPAHRTIALSFDAAGHATFTCETSRAPRPGDRARVNEVATGTAAAAGDEFVELYNTGTAAIDVGGWKVVYRSASGASDTTLGDDPGRHDDRPQAASTSSAAARYAGTATADQRSARASPAPAARRRARRRGRPRRQRRLGHGRERARRDRAAPAPPATTPGSSIVRLPDGHDTGNNATDFTVTRPRHPGRRTTDRRGRSLSIQARAVASAPTTHRPDRAAPKARRLAAIAGLKQLDPYSEWREAPP